MLLFPRRVSKSLLISVLQFLSRDFFLIQPSNIVIDTGHFAFYEKPRVERAAETKQRCQCIWLPDHSESSFPSSPAEFSWNQRGTGQGQAHGQEILRRN